MGQPIFHLARSVSEEVDLPFTSLTGLTSYHHLLNLENLDISRNDVESLTREIYLPCGTGSYSICGGFGHC